MKRLSLLALGAAAAAAMVPARPQHKDGASSKPLVASASLQETIQPARLWRRAESLYEMAKKSIADYGHPTRVIGSKGHVATVAYIRSELARLDDYYDVTEQTYGADTGNISDWRLTIAGRAPASATAMLLSPATAHRRPVTGNLVLARNAGCDPADYPRAAATEDTIALIRRGACDFGVKAQRAGRAGALAAIIYDDDPGRDAKFLGTLAPIAQGQIPTFALSGREGARHAAHLQSGGGGPLRATAYMDATARTVPTSNLLAQTKATAPRDCILVGAHSDSVAAGPGINDDGSGSLAVLEVAVQLARFRVNNCVRFAWWTAEEVEGAAGSDHYVASLPDAELDGIRLFMDYDMLASPNFAYQVYNGTDGPNPAGSQALRDLYVAWFASQGLGHTLVPFDGRSDYDAFLKAGIPSGGVSTGADDVKTEAEAAMFGGAAGVPYDGAYHRRGDDLKNLNLGAWEVSTKLVAHATATYAASLAGFPRGGSGRAAAGRTAPRSTYRGGALSA